MRKNPFRLTAEGFKGASTKTDLGRRTYIHGPNEAGKSRLLEAAHLAITGRLPIRYAQTNQAVGDLMGAAPAVVELEDGATAEGPHWVKREFKRDGASISQKVSTSDSPPGAKKADTGRWAGINHLLLDFEAFEVMPPKEKGRYILELCATRAESSRKEMLEALKLYAAKAIAGQMATSLVWSDIEESLRPDEVPVAESFLGSNGVFEWLRSAIDERRRPSDNCLQMLSAAKEEQAEVRKAIRDSKAALDLLGHDPQAPTPREEDEARLARKITRLSERVEKARRLRKAHEDLAPRVEPAQEEARRSQEEAQNIRKRLEDLRGQLEEAGDPEKPGPSGELKKLVAERQKLGEEIENARAWILQAENAETERSAIEEGLNAAKARLGEVQQSSELAFFTAVGDLPEDAHPSIPHIRGLLAIVRQAFDKRIQKATEEEEDYSERHKKAEERLLSFGDITAQKAGLAGSEARYEWLVGRVAQEEGEIAGELEAWQQGREARATMQAQAEALEGEGARAQEAADNKQSAYKSIAHRAEQARHQAEGAKGLDDADVEARIEEAEEERAKVSAAIEKDRQFRDITESAFRAESRLKAWGIALESIERARDHYVEEAAGELLASANKVYQVARPADRIGVTLETPTGRTTCQFHVVKEGGVVVKEKALSTGAWCLVLAAFSAASVAKQKRGLRTLLIEAQPLDPKNMVKLLQMLTAKGPSIVLVAATVHPESMPGAGEGISPEWTIVEVGDKRPVEKQAIDQGQATTAADDERYVLDVKDWYNRTVVRRLKKKPQQRVSATLKRKILAIRQTRHDWRAIVEMHFDANPGAKDVRSIDLAWFTHGPNLIMWEDHAYKSKAEKLTTAMPGFPDTQ